MTKKIGIFTNGSINHASSRIRGYAYEPFLEKDGYKVVIVPRIPDLKRDNTLKKVKFALLKKLYYFRRVIHLLFSSKKDVLIFQKILLSKLEKFIVRSKSLNYIFDFDDAIYIDARDAKIKGKVNEMISKALAVFAGNQVLFDYAKIYNENSFLIPTPVDVFEKQMENTSNEAPVIGWIGSPWTQKYLLEIENTLRKLEEEEIQFSTLFVGVNTDFSLKLGATVFQKWELNCEEKYLKQIDIGVMPLTNDSYSEGKSGYKLLLYMGSGIPGVASPVGVNADVISHGENGFLATTSNDWYNYLKSLILDVELRKSMGLKAKQTVVGTYDRESVYKKISTVISEFYGKR